MYFQCYHSNLYTKLETKGVQPIGIINYLEKDPKTPEHSVCQLISYYKTKKKELRAFCPLSTGAAFFILTGPSISWHHSTNFLSFWPSRKDTAAIAGIMIVKLLITDLLFWINYNRVQNQKGRTRNLKKWQTECVGYFAQPELDLDRSIPAFIPCRNFLVAGFSVLPSFPVLAPCIQCSV